jgi:hypothetical protein
MRHPAEDWVIGQVGKWVFEKQKQIPRAAWNDKRRPSTQRNRGSRGQKEESATPKTFHHGDTEKNWVIV